MPSLAEKGRATFKFREMTAAEAEKNEKVDALTFTLDYFFGRFMPTHRGGYPPTPANTLGDHFKILAAATGSGKASVGPELYMRYFDIQHRNIAVLQPTVATATAIPSDVLTIPKYKPVFKLGQNLGYQTGDLVRKPVNGVIFMTTGVIGQMLRVMTDDQFMRKFFVILIDEAHVRKVELDIVTFMLKRLVARNLSDPRCPFVVAMSGTMPIEKYADYLGVSRADVIAVPGETHKRTPHWLDKDTADYVKTAVATILEIHAADADEPERGDIIVFVKSGEITREISKQVGTANEKLAKKMLVTTIDAMGVKSGSDEFFATQRPLAYARVNGHVPTRRVIIGTPAIETGLTIPSAKHCIDTGYEHSVTYDPVWSAEVVTHRPVTRSMMTQRIGRIGRKFPGDYYPMYTEATAAAMIDQQDPDVLTRDIAANLLDMIIADTMPSTWDRTFIKWPSPTGSFSIASIDLIDMPSADSLLNALERLFVLGLIDPTGRATLMGCLAVRFRERLESVRMILEGYLVGANIADLVTMAAIIEVDPTTLVNRSSKKGATFAGRASWAACDIIELLLTWRAISAQIAGLAAPTKQDATSVTGTRSTTHLRKWMEARGLVYTQWLYVITTRDRIISTLIGAGLDPYTNGIGLPRHKYDLSAILQDTPKLAHAEIRKLKACMIAGYMLNTLTYDTKSRAYIHDYTHQPVAISSISLSALTSPDPTKKARPRKLLAFDITLKLPRVAPNGRATDGRVPVGLYTFNTEAVSVIDGFVELDETLAIS